MTKLLYCNGEFYPEDQAVLRAQDRGFRFGDGVFETVRVEAGVPYQWAFHMQRLQAGLVALRITAKTEDLESIASQLLAHNRMTEALVRIAISRGVGSRGYLPAESAPTIVIEVMDLPHPATPMKLWLSSQEAISPQALPVRYKLAQGINNTLARLEALDEGCTEALRLNAAGDIAETTSANIFWLKNKTLYTPALSCGVLEGSIRHAVFRLSPWNVEEGHYTLEEIREAEAIVLTNIALLATPVASLAPIGWHWESQAVAEQLTHLIQHDIKQKNG